MDAGVAQEASRCLYEAIDVGVRKHLPNLADNHPPEDRPWIQVDDEKRRYKDDTILYRFLQPMRAQTGRYVEFLVRMVKFVNAPQK